MLTEFQNFKQISEFYDSSYQVASVSLIHMDQPVL